MTYLLPSSTPYILLFADDTKCLRNVSSLSDCHSLQDDLVHLSSWCLRWNLQFNETKCVLLRICSNLPHTLFNYTINGTSIQAVDCHHDLGIFMSCDLKWSNHLKHISAQAYKVLGLIRLFLLWFAHLGKEELVPFASSFSTNLWLSDLETPPFEGYYCT